MFIFNEKKILTMIYYYLEIHLHKNHFFHLDKVKIIFHPFLFYSGDFQWNVQQEKEVKVLTQQY